MLYVTAELVNGSRKNITHAGYGILDIGTGNLFRLSDFEILHLINNGVKIAGLDKQDIESHSKVTYTWKNRLNAITEKRNIIGRDKVYIYLGAVKNQPMVIDCYGTMRMMEVATFKTMFKAGMIANAVGQTYCEDTIKFGNNKEFNDLIKHKYAEFIGKARALGSDRSFKYEIFQDTVTLTRYTGNCENAIVPSFVTGLGKRAFSYEGLNSLSLSNGLQVIGAGTCMGNKFNSIILPETTQLVDPAAFDRGVKVCKTNANTLTFR